MRHARERRGVDRRCEVGGVVLGGCDGRLDALMIVDATRLDEDELVQQCFGDGCTATTCIRLAGCMHARCMPFLNEASTLSRGDGV